MNGLICRLAVLVVLTWPPIVHAQVHAPTSAQPGDHVVVTMLGAGGMAGAVIRGADGSVVAQAPSFAIALSPRVKLS